MTIPSKKSITYLLPLIALAFALLITQSADAGQDLIVDSLLYWRDQTGAPVDVDGDGRSETFAVNYTIHADGTATGVVQIGPDTIYIEQGSISINDDIITSTAKGVLANNPNHIVQITVKHSTDDSSGGGYGILLFDTTSSMTHFFSADLEITIR